MHQLIEEGVGLHFVGGLWEEGDLRAAALLAQGCESYRIDEDDEDYLEGERSCFNCRYRRWLSGGFSCLRGFPSWAPGRL